MVQRDGFLHAILLQAPCENGVERLGLRQAVMACNTLHLNCRRVGRRLDHFADVIVVDGGNICSMTRAVFLASLSSAGKSKPFSGAFFLRGSDRSARRARRQSRAWWIPAHAWKCPWAALS